MEQEKKSKKKTLHILLMVMLLAIIVVLGIIIYKLLNKEEEPVTRLPSEELVVDEPEEAVNSGVFTTDMNMVWTFPKGKLVSKDAVVGNSSINVYDAYFDLYLEDEKETLLYSSPIIPVGKRLGKLKLDKGLPTGEYEALCTFHLVDDDEKEVDNVTFYVTLIFE